MSVGFGDMGSEMTLGSTFGEQAIGKLLGSQTFKNLAMKGRRKTVGSLGGQKGFVLLFYSKDGEYIFLMRCNRRDFKTEKKGSLIV